MVKYLQLVVGWSLIWVVAAPSEATEITPLAEQQVLRCAVYGDPPWIINEAGELKGVAPYYAKAFQRVTDYEIELVPMPYKRSLLSIDNPDIDFVLALEDEEISHLAEPYVRIGRIAILLYSLRPIDELMNALHPQKVSAGILRGAEHLAEKELPPWSRMDVNSESSSFWLVAKGRLDVTAMSRNSYEYLTEQNPDAPKGYIRDIGFADVYAWINKKRTKEQGYEMARRRVEEQTFHGKLVLDWYTVNLPKVEEPQWD